MKSPGDCKMLTSLGTTDLRGFLHHSVLDSFWRSKETRGPSRSWFSTYAALGNLLGLLVFVFKNPEACIPSQRLWCTWLGIQKGIWRCKNAIDKSTMQPGLRPAGLKYPLICKRRKGRRADGSLLAEAGLAVGALTLPPGLCSHYGAVNMGDVSTASFWARGSVSDDRVCERREGRKCQCPSEQEGVSTCLQVFG